MVLAITFLALLSYNFIKVPKITQTARQSEIEKIEMMPLTLTKSGWPDINLWQYHDMLSTLKLISENHPHH